MNEIGGEEISLGGILEHKCVLLLAIERGIVKAQERRYCVTT